MTEDILHPAQQTTLRGDILDALDWLEYSATIKDNVLNVPEINKHNEMARAQAERIRLALFSLPAAPVKPDCGAWRPIETAPRDGTIILLGNYGSEPRPAYYGMASKTFGAGADKRFPWVFLDNTNGVNQCTDDETGPTHWMPLPAPPSSVTSTAETDRNLAESLCDDCPPAGHDGKRCLVCPRPSGPLPSTDGESHG